MPKPRKQTAQQTETVTEDVTLDVHQWAQLAEQAAALSLELGRIVGLDEYLMMRVEAYMAHR
jgi:hypothetical protein